MYTLQCYDGGKQFGNRVQVVIGGRGERVLYSSGTIVAAIGKKGEFYRLWRGTNKNTMREVNSFRIDRKLKPITKREWDAMPVIDSAFLSL